jgi:uncharacterized protein (TIGR00269 family)
MLCQECFIKSTNEKVLKDIRRQKLIEKGDKVLVALSGGKDSVMVLDILNNLRKRRIIDLMAVTIDEGIGGYREDGVRIAALNAERIGVNHKIVSFKEYIMADSDDRNACTYCGVCRRWILNQVAREEGANKIATGHNLDDETQSILMNYLEGNIQNLTRIGVKSQSNYEGFTVKIKPLREIPEKETALYAIARNLPVHLAGCPYAGDSFRAKIGTFLKQISKDHPTIMYSTLRGFDKIKPVLKEEFSKTVPMEVCQDCGEPSTGKICKACSFRRLWD